MADRQFNPLADEPCPADWVLPGSVELLLKNVYAEFDGSGAAGSYQPTLEILTDSGHVLGSYNSDTTVAAGGSADVTFFPHVGHAASATPTGTVSWVHLHNIAVSVPSQTSPHTLLDFTTFTEYTNDSSTFTIVPGNGLQITAAGFYVVSVSVIFTGQVAAASAEAVFNISGTGNEIDATDTFMKPGFAGGVAICSMSEGFMLDNTGSTSLLSLRQTCGITASASCEVSVARLTSDQGNF